MKEHVELYELVLAVLEENPALNTKPNVEELARRIKTTIEKFIACSAR